MRHRSAICTASHPTLKLLSAPPARPIPFVPGGPIYEHRAGGHVIDETREYYLTEYNHAQRCAAPSCPIYRTPKGRISYSVGYYRHPIHQSAPTPTPARAA